jgi:hypothetical protein
MLTEKDKKLKPTENIERPLPAYQILKNVFNPGDSCISASKIIYY